jgi:hypothetical protein
MNGKQVDEKSIARVENSLQPAGENTYMEKV